MASSKRTQTKTTRHHINISVQASDTNIERNTNNTNTFNDLALLTLDINGVIKDCNKAGADLLGCEPSKVTRLNISKFLPRLGEVALLKGERVNPYLRFLSRVGHQFEIIGIGGARFTSQLFFNEAENQGPHCLRIIIQPIGTGTALS